MSLLKSVNRKLHCFVMMTKQVVAARQKQGVVMHGKQVLKVREHCVPTRRKEMYFREN